MEKIRVLIVDDSALVRKLLTEIFQSTTDIEVVGVAADPYIARDKIKQLNPDVLTLDIEMPRMDGLTFLRNLMRLRPMPVVMVSTLTEHGAEATLQALALGAVDFVAKPKVDVAQSLAEYADEIVEKVRMAARAHVSVLETSSPVVKPSVERAQDIKLSADAVLSAQPIKPPPKHLGRIIAIGASTGGTEAIKEVVRQLPNESPPVVISQHLPAPFSESFARHVDMVSPMRAQLALHGQELMPGHIYIAPGDYHLLVIRDGTRYIGHLHDGPPVNRHKPSVDVMFRSVAQCAAQQAIAVLLTGMGNDGAQGMKEIHDTGARTIIQDEKTSVVWGMPGEAYRLGAADYMLPLRKIASQIIALSNQ